MSGFILVGKLCTWLYSSSDRGLGFPHPLHHALQLFGSSLRRQLWRFDDGVVGVINPETQHYTLLNPGRPRGGRLTAELDTDFRGLSPNMTPLKVSALATESCSENSTKAKRVGWVSSPAIRTNFTLPTCLKNSRSWSAVVVCGQEDLRSAEL